jgi:hypothetical protein
MTQNSGLAETSIRVLVKYKDSMNSSVVHDSDNSEEPINLPFQR